MERQEALVPDEQMESAVAAITGEAFTIFEFMRVYSDLYPATWLQLIAVFGEKGDGSRRSYTAATYLGNRLWQLTKKPGSPLLPLVRWQRGGVETPNQRRATPEERAMGAETIVRVFRKRLPE